MESHDPKVAMFELFRCWKIRPWLNHGESKVVIYASFCGKIIDPLVISEGFLFEGVAHFLTKGCKKTPLGESQFQSAW